MWNDLIAFINTKIYPNTANEITAAKHREALASFANRTHNAYPQGVADPNGAPSLDGDACRWWFATRGSYPNYGNITINKDIGIIIYRNGWSKHEVDLFETNVYEVTNINSLTFTISGATVPDHTTYSDAEMDMRFISVKRGSTVLRYNKTNPNRLEYFAEQIGNDVRITLGRLPQLSDIFRIKIES